MKEPSLPDKIVAIHKALKRKKVAHAFGGALALAYYAEPRATIDIDLNLFLSPKEYRRVEQAFSFAGLRTDVDSDKLEKEGQVRLWWGRTPLDLFFSYDEIHEEMSRRRRSVPFGEETIPILAPEHLVVCKAIFNRPKDWLDIEQVVAMVPNLDIDEIGNWLERIAGPAASLRRFNAQIDRQLRD